MAYHHSQFLGFLFVCTCRGAWLQAWHAWRVKRQAVQESPGALSSPSWEKSWTVSTKTWRLTLLFCHGVFHSILWVLITGQHLLLLFYIFHFQDAATFSWICGGPADLIILSSFVTVIISAWSYHTHTHPSQRMSVKDRRSPLSQERLMLSESWVSSALWVLLPHVQRHLSGMLV